MAPRVNDYAQGEGLRRQQCGRIAFEFGERERQAKRGKGEVYTGNTRGARTKGGNETEMAIPVPPSETRMSKQKKMM